MYKRRLRNKYFLCLLQLSHDINFEQLFTNYLLNQNCLHLTYMYYIFKSI